MTRKTYLFYDIETTGLNKAFDQVIQFAAIRTDLQLNELKRYELRVKLNPDITPSPYALITNRVAVDHLQQGISEYDAMLQIHHWMNEPGTISLGYNTLDFDDQFLRFSFYRNLLSPYTHQYANACSRMDIYPITGLYYSYQQDILNWPSNGEKHSLRLEDLNAANHFATGRAHDAMVDVEITLALARKLAAKKEMWEYAHSYFEKTAEEERLQKATKNLAVLFDVKLGHQARYHSIVYPLGFHQHYNKDTHWLRLDNILFEENRDNIMSDLSLENPYGENKKSLWVNKKKIAEDGFILPFNDRYLKHLDLALAQKNLKWLEENPDILNSIKSFYTSHKYPSLPNTDPDARLYLDGFPSQEEEKFRKLFHAANEIGKAKLLQQYSHLKISVLGKRLLAKHYPQVLYSDDAAIFADHLHNIQTNENYCIDYRGKQKLNCKMALAEIQKIRLEKNLDKEQTDILDGYEKFLTEN